MLLPLSASTQVNLNKGLAAYYPFNGNFKDESPAKNHPTKINAGLTSDRNNRASSACFFDGKTNFIRIPDHPALHFNSAYSISAWVKVNGFYKGLCHGNRILMKGPRDYLPGNFFLTFDDNYSSGGNNCETENPDTKRQVFYAPDASPVNPVYIKPGKWYHLTYVNDGREAKLFVDCQLAAKGYTENRNIWNRYDLLLGKMDNEQYPYWFNGALDELRLYNRVLNVDEIRELCKPELNAATVCSGINKPSAAFTYTISECTKAEFRLTEAIQKEIRSVIWYLGDGARANNPAPIHRYEKTGTYKVKAIVTNKNGCSDTVTRNIRLQTINADFVYSEKGKPGQIEFRATNNKASYSWDFGDGNVKENESVATHFYSSPGNYLVKSIAKNSSGCEETKIKPLVIVLPVPEQQATLPVPELKTNEMNWAPTGLEERTKDIQQTILLDHDSVRISVFDNGVIDGDSITLVFNDKVIVSHLLLGNQPMAFSLKLDHSKTTNELIMFAENLGSIPPNTALLIIEDGEKRHLVYISSSTKSNGAINFIWNGRSINVGK